jgi:adenylate cyclase class 2
MNNNLIEVEIKFQLTDPLVLEEKIRAVGGKELHHDIFQRTVRLDTPDESLKQKGVFLRVRDGEKKIMTVKSKLPGADKNFKERQELEIEVSDILLAEKMLESLGFTQKWIMEKYRTEYELAGTILALDRLPFGDYLEIEGEKDQIEEVVKILELKNQPRLTATYWHLFDDYKKANNLTGENIIFNK